MNEILKYSIWLPIAIAVVIIATNYIWVFDYRRNLRRGIDKPVVMIPFAGPIIGVYPLYYLSGSTLLAFSLFVVDPATWTVLIGLLRTIAGKA